MTRGLPDVEGEITYKNDGKVFQIANMETGQAAIGSEEELKAVYGNNSAAPTASMIKVVTSMVALQKDSDLDQVIVLDDNDVAFYRNTFAVNGSRLQVSAGEQLTLRQMHEALLLVSANNIADSLVYHLFGTQDNYRVAANKWLANNGLSNTVIGIDASGLDPSTVSTPSDMIKIAQIALENPTVSQIVKMKKATFPFEGEVENTNKLLDDGYHGIKTGNSNEAGSCLIFATQYEDETIVGALMGQPYDTTFDKAKELVGQIQGSFSQITIPAGTVVGKYSLPWGGEGVITTTYGVSKFTWSDAEANIEVKPYQQQSFVQEVGTLELSGVVTPLEVKTVTANADMLWRLSHLDQLKW